MYGKRFSMIRLAAPFIIRKSTEAFENLDTDFKLNKIIIKVHTYNTDNNRGI